MGVDAFMSTKLELTLASIFMEQCGVFFSQVTVSKRVTSYSAVILSVLAMIPW